MSMTGGKSCGFTGKHVALSSNSDDTNSPSGRLGISLPGMSTNESLKILVKFPARSGTKVTSIGEEVAGASIPPEGDT